MVNQFQQRWNQTHPSTCPVSHRRLRLWNQRKYSAPAAAERFSRHGCAGEHNCQRSTLAKSGWRFSFEWAGRSRGSSVRTQGNARFDGEEADFRDLSWPPDSRVRVRRIDLQIKIWASWREPAGKRFEQRQSGNHGAKSRVRRRSRVAAVKCGSNAHQFERRHRGGNAVQGTADLQCAISSRSCARPP